MTDDPVYHPPLISHPLIEFQQAIQKCAESADVPAEQVRLVVMGWITYDALMEYFRTFSARGYFVRDRIQKRLPSGSLKILGVSVYRCPTVETGYFPVPS